MTIRFRVAPYALFDAMRALENTNDPTRHIEYGVTKEDGYLIVWAEEHHITKNVAQTSCPGGTE